MPPSTTKLGKPNTLLFEYKIAAIVLQIHSNCIYIYLAQTYDKFNFPVNSSRLYFNPAVPNKREQYDIRSIMLLKPQADWMARAP